MVLALTGLILCPVMIAAKDYPIGTKFQSIFAADFPSGKMQVPLPPGTWQLAGSFKDQSTGPSGFTYMYQFLLVRLENSALTGRIDIRIPADIIGTFWNSTSNCEKSKYKERSFWLNGASYHESENCVSLHWLRGYKKNHRYGRKIKEFIGDIEIPKSWIRYQKFYTEGPDFLHHSVAIPLEKYGFEPGSYGYSDSPWVPNNIDANPEKKAFSEKAVAWAKSWDQLVEKGIKNKLKASEVLQHPRMDGLVLTIPKAKKTESAKDKSQKAGTAMARLKKLKDLFDAGLISEDEYQEKKKEILSEM